MDYAKLKLNTIDEYDLDELKRKSMAYDEEEYKYKLIKVGIIVGVLALFAIVGLCMWFFPKYSVWSAEQKGKAQLAEAEYSKQTQIQEAQSNLEAERLNAQSEIERAKGAAEARKTEGLGMTAEQYIQYLWVKKLDLSKSKTIYLPTEGGLPKVTMEVEK